MSAYIVVILMIVGIFVIGYSALNSVETEK